MSGVRKEEALRAASPPSLPTSFIPWILVTTLVGITLTSWVPASRIVPVVRLFDNTLHKYGLGRAAMVCSFLGWVAHFAEFVFVFSIMQPLLRQGLMRGPQVAGHLVMTLVFGYHGILEALRVRRRVYEAAGVDTPIIFPWWPESLVKVRNTSDVGASKGKLGRQSPVPPKGTHIKRRK